MKNMYGETVKPQYEVALKSFANTPTAREDCDYESQEFLVADNYRDAVRMAKEWSKDIGKNVLCNNNVELAEVAIICYFQDDTSSYNRVWEETYINGKKDYRYID